MIKLILIAAILPSMYVIPIHKGKVEVCHPAGCQQAHKMMIIGPNTTIQSKGPNAGFVFCWRKEGWCYYGVEGSKLTVKEDNSVKFEGGFGIWPYLYHEKKPLEKKGGML